MYFLVDYEDKETTLELLEHLTLNMLSLCDVIDWSKKGSPGKNDFKSLLCSYEFFKELITNDAFSKEDCKYLIDNIETQSELEILDNNTSLLHYILEKNFISFKDFIEKHRNIIQTDCIEEISCLSMLLEDEKVLSNLFDKHLLTKEDYKYLLDAILTIPELCSFSENSELVKYTVKSGAVSFRGLVDKYCSIEDFDGDHRLNELIVNSSIFQYLIKNALIDVNDCKYLLKNIRKNHERIALCSNSPLLEYCFRNSLIDVETIEDFNENLKNNNSPNFFAQIYNQHTEEDNTFLELVAGLEEVYNLLRQLKCSNKEKQTLFELCQSSDKARNNLKQLIENNVQNTYNFTKLKTLLVKDNEKKKLKMNF